MERIKRYLHEIFIDGLSGMAIGLFSTLIVGTILSQLSSVFYGSVKDYLTVASCVAKTITGAGIGVGVSSKLKGGPLVTVSAAVAGMVGAFPSIKAMEAFAFGKPGEPLGAFLAALVAVWLGRILEGRTKVDILITPFVSIVSGTITGLALGGPISSFMKLLGELVNVNVEKYPVLGGALISVCMGMILTLPISSAAIGMSMGITGLAAGAATIGCCCNMVGFAVMSFRENGVGGLISQGIGTSMLQVPNIIKKPIIWIPPIVSSALLGPISSKVLKMTSTPIGSGMGSSGLVGQIATYGEMVKNGFGQSQTILLILVMHFILPAIVTFLIAELMRKKKLIEDKDMSLSV